MEKYIFDCHSHVQFPAYDADRDVVIERARKAGVKMLAVGTQVSTSEAGIKLAHEYPDDIWAVVGFHPSHVVGRSDQSVGATNSWHHDKKEQPEAAPEEFNIGKLRELAADEKVVAIGECGLDYFRIMNNELGIKEKQKEVFLKQVELAQDLDKALMIHCRPSKGTDDAYEDLLDLCQASRQKRGSPKAASVKRHMSVIHFYVGSLEITKKLVEAGFYFTFGGVITFAKDYDESIKYIPSDRILLETDCPYVAPLPYRGKRNEPLYIMETAKKMADIKEIPLDKFILESYNNSRTVFSIK